MALPPVFVRCFRKPPGVSEHVGRRGHAVGNKMFNRLYRVLVGSGVSDILTGCRVCLTRLVKSFPAVSSGFEIETELAVHVSQLRLPFAEVSVSYGTRPAGSTSEPSPTSRGSCRRGRCVSGLVPPGDRPSRLARGGRFA